MRDAVRQFWEEVGGVGVGLGVPERIGGSNADYGLSGDWASTRGNGPQVSGLSDRSPIGDLL